jgi:hypothetical protein
LDWGRKQQKLRGMLNMQHLIFNAKESSKGETFNAEHLTPGAKTADGHR